MQATNRPVNDHLKVRRTDLLHSRAEIGESRRQVSWFGNCRAQIQNQLTPFEHHLVGLLEGFFKDSSRRLVFTEPRCRGMETQQQTLDSLKKSVVQLARDALSFFQPCSKTLVKPSGCLLQPQPIQCPHKSSRRRNTQCPEPSGLIECRRNRKIQLCSCFIPHAVIVACDHVEYVAAWF